MNQAGRKKKTIKQWQARPILKAGPEKQLVTHPGPSTQQGSQEPVWTNVVTTKRNNGKEGMVESVPSPTITIGRVECQNSFTPLRTLNGRGVAFDKIP